MYQLIVKENIEDLIYKIRDKYVMLDSDLAKLFNIETKYITRLVQRNIEKFKHEDYFKITTEENDSLRSQFATSSLESNSLRCQNVTLKNGRGQHKKYLSYVFTLEGVLILSTIIRKKDTYKIVEEIKNAFNKKNYEIEEYKEIQRKIYEIRGVQVMLDYDLAELYKCTNGTKSINLAVKRNIDRFPEDFYFQLTEEECLRFQFETSKVERGGRRYNTYAFTEQGVAMLSSVLDTKEAKQMSIDIMRAFVAMRKFISHNMDTFKELNEIKTLTIQNTNDIKILQDSFERLEGEVKINHIFFEGQIYDAYSLLIDILNEAKEEIIIIDNYASKELLDIVKDINKKVIIISSNMKEEHIVKYKKQYDNVDFKNIDKFHDRFIIIDKKILYNCGASFKDLGKKCFCLNKINDNSILEHILNEIRTK